MSNQADSRTLGRHRLYEQLSLKGPIPSRMVWLPDPLPPAPPALITSLTDPERVMARLFERALDGDATLHRFEWLSLASQQGTEYQKTSKLVLQRWMDVYGGFDPHVWRPGATAERLTHLLRNIEFLSVGQDAPWREQLRDTLCWHIRHLRRSERKLSVDHPDALSVSLARALGVMTFPETQSLGEVTTSRLDRLLQKSVQGMPPVSWRHPARLIGDYMRLEMLVSAFVSRRLSAPAALTGTSLLARELLALIVGPDGRVAHLPGFSEIQHPAFELSQQTIMDSAAHSHAYSRWRCAAASTTLMVDSGHERDPTGAAGFCLYDGNAPVIVSCGRPSALAAGLVCGMDTWRKALDTAAAASTLDGVENAPASVRSELGDDGRLIDLERRSGSSLHRRRLLLRPGGHEVLGEDLARGDIGVGAYRFHLPPNTEVSLLEDSRTARIRLPTGQHWEMVTNAASLTIEPSVFAWNDGMADDSEQLVLAPENEGVRWAIRQVSEAA